MRSLMGLGKRRRLRVDKPTITKRLIQLRTHAARLCLSLSISSSHADCRTEAFFLETEARGAPNRRDARRHADAPTPASARTPNFLEADPTNSDR
jgi:hypothetical protein